MQTKSYKFNKFTKRLPNRQRNEILVILVGKNDDESQNKKSRLPLVHSLLLASPKDKWRVQDSFRGVVSISALK